MNSTFIIKDSICEWTSLSQRVKCSHCHLLIRFDHPSEKRKDQMILISRAHSAGIIRRSRSSHQMTHLNDLISSERRCSDRRTTRLSSIHFIQWCWKNCLSFQVEILRHRSQFRNSTYVPRLFLQTVRLHFAWSKRTNSLWFASEIFSSHCRIHRAEKSSNRKKRRTFELHQRLRIAKTRRWFQFFDATCSLRWWSRLPSSRPRAPIRDWSAEHLKDGMRKQSERIFNVIDLSSFASDRFQTSLLGFFDSWAQSCHSIWCKNHFDWFHPIP